MLGYFVELSVVNTGSTALVKDAAPAIFGGAGVSAATRVMIVFCFRCLNVGEIYYVRDIKHA